MWNERRQPAVTPAGGINTGGETQIQLAFATNMIGKRIIMIPSGNALNLQTLDLNKALETFLRKK